MPMSKTNTEIDPNADDKVILITGASSGFGYDMARHLAQAGHTVYGSMRDIDDRNADTAATMEKWAMDEGVDLLPIELDVTSTEEVGAAAETVVDEQGRIDVLINNAGTLVTGYYEAFTPDQFTSMMDVNFLGLVRVNRAVLPYMREQGSGLVLYISSTLPGLPMPYMAPYVTSKTAGEALAEASRFELAPWGIETVIVQPGPYQSTGHFGHAGEPGDTERIDAYADAEDPDEFFGQLASRTPEGRDDPSFVSERVASIVDMDHGSRPHHTVIDPQEDGVDILNAVFERVQAHQLREMGLDDSVAMN